MRRGGWWIMSESAYSTSRPVDHVDLGWIPHVRDRLGRKQIRRPPLPAYLLIMARIDPTRVREVPQLAIAEDGVDDQGAYALLSCPCGGQPIVREGLEKCVGCERYYTLTAPGCLHVVYGAMEPPPLIRRR